MKKTILLVVLIMTTIAIPGMSSTARDPDSGSPSVLNTVGLTYNITGGFGVTAEITNLGIQNVTKVPWTIYVKGGILGLINKNVTGTIDIPAGKTVTVTSGIILGFGPIEIAVWVADAVQVTSGNQFIIFTTVKK